MTLIQMGDWCSKVSPWRDELLTHKYKETTAMVEMMITPKYRTAERNSVSLDRNKLFS